MDFSIETADLVSMLVSIICGGLIGFEREYKNKSTGLRTIVLICLGSTIFTIVSRHGAGADDRISANILTGIGFIGAGVIFKDKLSVLGLTTAAVIWTTAAIGMTTGIGYHALAVVFTLVTLIILIAVSYIEKLVNTLQKTKTISVTFSESDMGRIEQLEEKMNSQQLKTKRLQLSKADHSLSITFQVKGKPDAIQKLLELMANMDDISDFYSG